MRFQRGETRVHGGIDEWFLAGYNMMLDINAGWQDNFSWVHGQAPDRRLKINKEVIDGETPWVDHRMTEYAWQNAVEKPVGAKVFSATILRPVIRLLTKHSML